MTLTSPAFKNDQAIPIGYTGEGEDISPPLEWSNIPQNAREFVLILEDLDAISKEEHGGPFVHWMAYNISRNISSLPAGILQNELRLTLPVSLEQGTNSFGKVGYRGPMPPVADGPHHYVFNLLALDREVGVRPGLTRARLMKALDGHVIASAQLTGTYERRLDLRNEQNQFRGVDVY
jgi:Raf kinase inhibitor-like YbhB/YbcL family protein